MSIEGGEFHCGRHDFTTDSVEDWNKHMSKEGHIDISDTHCIECGKHFIVEIPFQPIQADGSKGISLRCDECEAKSGQQSK